MVQCPETVIKDRVNVPGGINFDAKLRRESTSLVDLFYGHISGMDALARGLRNAAKMLEVHVFCKRFFQSHMRLMFRCACCWKDSGSMTGELCKED